MLHGNVKLRSSFVSHPSSSLINHKTGDERSRKTADMQKEVGDSLNAAVELV